MTVPALNNRVHPRRMGALIVASVLVFAVAVGVGLFGFLGGFEDDVAVAKRQQQQAADHRAKKAKQAAASSPVTSTTTPVPSSPLEKGVHKIVTRSNLLKRLMLNRQISRETMFVNTASFRDVFCRQTVRNIYEMALHPERIFMGVIDQRMVGDIMCIPPEYLRNNPFPHLPLSPYVTTTIPKDKDPVHQPVLRRFQSCWKSNGFCPLDNIRNRIVHDTEARGPTYGRFVGGLMYQGESFYMMIDSHSMFAPHFDEFYILDILRMKESFIVESSSSSSNINKQLEEGETSGNGGVISNYPGTFNRFDKTPNYGDNLVSMCRIHYVKELKILRNGVSHVAQSPRRKPLRQPHTAGGFLFSDATVQLVVPYDPYLDFVFDGEEVLYSIRLFTRGIDAYMPSMPNIFHHYERHKAHRFWSVKGTKWGKYVEITRQRLHYFMQTYHNQTTKLLVDATEAHKKGVADSEDVYAPGNTRSVQAFYDYAGIGRSTWKVSDDFCNRVTREAAALQKSTPDWRW